VFRWTTTTSSVSWKDCIGEIEYADGHDSRTSPTVKFLAMLSHHLIAELPRSYQRRKPWRRAKVNLTDAWPPRPGCATVSRAAFSSHLPSAHLLLVSTIGITEDNCRLIRRSIRRSIW
jgi:hypothetical protein